MAETGAVGCSVALRSKVREISYTKKGKGACDRGCNPATLPSNSLGWQSRDHRRSAPGWLGMFLDALGGKFPLDTRLN